MGEFAVVGGYSDTMPVFTAPVAQPLEETKVNPVPVKVSEDEFKSSEQAIIAPKLVQEAKVATKPSETKAPPAPLSRVDPETLAQMAKVDQARETVAPKKWENRKEIVDPVIREAGLKAIESGKYNKGITDAEAVVIRRNLSGEELEKFNKDFKSDTYKNDLSSKRLDKLGKVLKDHESTYFDLNWQSDTAKHLTYKAMASNEYLAYKNSNNEPTRMANGINKPITKA